MGINKLTDIDPSEYLSELDLPLETNDNGSKFEIPNGFEAPAAFDWRTRGVGSHIKNQLKCGSCWSFAVTGTLEWVHFLETNNTISLSEQNLIDCTKSVNNGCNGGSTSKTYTYLKDHAITSEANYPYEALDTSPCRYTSSQSVVKVIGYTTVAKNENALQAAVASVSPITISIDATYLHNYESGIYYDVRCSSTKHNHAVILVGYGSNNNVDYWLIKNSWGTDWGLDGYFKLTRNRNGHCAITTNALYPSHG